MNAGAPRPDEEPAMGAAPEPEVHMSVQGFYQLAVWLPLLVPGSVFLVVRATGMEPSGAVAGALVELLIYSLVYGGIPYIIAAVVVTIRIDRLSEPAIRRLALQSPAWVLAAWLVFAALISFAAGSARMFIGLAGLGAAATLLLGYAWVALVFTLRELLGRAGLVRAERSSEGAAPVPAH